YPQIERHNVLKHAFHIGHELGHLVDEAAAIQTHFLAETVTLDEMSSLIELQAVETLTSQIEEQVASDYAAILLDVKTDISERLARWLTEFVCDIVAVSVSGPAAIASLLDTAYAEKTLDFDLYEIRSRRLDPRESNAAFYPPMRSRLAVMVNVAARHGFAEALDGLPMMSNALR